jgi:hypothetical protein
MGVAAMVIGIIAVVLGFVPLCGWLALLPAAIGLILGIVDVALKVKAKAPKGKGIAGIVLNAIAIAVILVWTLLFVSASSKIGPIMDISAPLTEEAIEETE